MSHEHTPYQNMHSSLELLRYRCSTAAEGWTISLMIAQKMLHGLFSSHPRPSYGYILYRLKPYYTT